MALTYRKPSPPLDIYIRFMWYGDGSSLSYPSVRIIAEPSLDLKVNLGGNITMYEESTSRTIDVLTEGWWGGLWGNPDDVELPLDFRCFCVSFKPGGAFPFL